ncbi:tumor necrosis factor receptor superfamily member 13C [Paroedura picta]|uniref:tumor necrosis factor receptor superfamily member 13C n=1 Tax=Paroedura picta TaxID=143630 RepID=UPI0040572EA1
MNNKTSPLGISPTCSTHHLCYDSLIRQCVSCNMLNRVHKETTAVPRVASTTSQEITPPAVVLKCPALISVAFACAGLVLAMAAVLWFVIQKQKRRTRKRELDEEDPEKTENCSIPFESQVHKEPYLPKEDNSDALKCLPLNDYSQGITLKDDSSKMAGSDVTEVASFSSCEKGNHTIPLPATELGSTVLVTTKTTQENFIKEELL